MKAVDIFIANRLASICKVFGFVEVYYCYDLVSPDSWPGSDKQLRRFYKCSNKHRLASFNSGLLPMTWLGLTKRVFRGNAANPFDIYKHKSYVWPEYIGNLAGVKSQLNIGKIVTLSIPCNISDSYVGRFTILLPKDLPDDGLFDTKDEAYKALLEFQLSISLNFSVDLNPLLGYKIVSPVSIYMLGLLSNGLDRKEVSSKMRLTTRGVDYHLTILKQSLGAKNLAHLIRLATNYRLV